MSDGVRWAWRPQEGPQKALVDCLAARISEILRRGAGARPDHPITGHERPTFAAMHGLTCYT
jgi:hypothetical protein